MSVTVSDSLLAHAAINVCVTVSDSLLAHAAMLLSFLQEVTSMNWFISRLEHYAVRFFYGFSQSMMARTRIIKTRNLHSWSKLSYIRQQILCRNLIKAVYFILLQFLGCHSQLLL